MRTLSIDIESFCETDIKTGTHKYAETAEVILFAYSFDDEPVEVIDTTWEDLPQEVISALNDPAILKTAFNAAFERAVIGNYYGLYLPPEQWECTMVRSAMAGYPLSLDESSKALGLTEKKDSVGKALIRYFCMPCKPSKTNGMRSRNRPDDNIEKWQQFIEYCRQDVVVEKKIRQALMWYKIPAIEKELWCLDQRKNERGVKVDMELIHSAIELDEQFREKLTEEAVAITGLGNVNSPAQLKKWLAEETDSAEIKSLDKLAVAKLLENVDSEKAKRILEIRALMSKSSIKKYLSMRNAAGRGNRIRGMIQYYGAQKSGRESGRICQPQNYPRIQDEFVELVDDTRQLVKNLDTESLNMIFDSLSSVLSQLLRTTFIADEGKEFGVLDFKAVEAVILAWVADEQWRIDFFRKGGDIYIASAMTMFKLKKEEVSKDIRQKSKISELLCIEENQLVLTDYGLIPIKDVKNYHYLWDGENWVKHKGVVFKGTKPVLHYQNLVATAEHLVWVEEKTDWITFEEAIKHNYNLLRTGWDKLKPYNNDKISNVYDILEAGPYNRFTVSNVLVHNCGYGGTKPAMQKMNETISDPKKRIPEKEMKPLIDTWRKANPNIVQLWWDTGKAAVNTVKTGQSHDVTKGISFWMAGKNLMMKMPSGRSITYVNAHLKKFWVGTVEKTTKEKTDEGILVTTEIVKVKLDQVITGSRSEFDAMMQARRLKQVKDAEPLQRESLCYWGSNQTTKKWEVIETYGPKLVQNAIEAWGRDLLMFSCLNMEKAGAPVVLTVHDELMVEPDKGKFTYEELAALMIQKPKWAGSMPLNCDGFLADYYKK